MIKLEAGKSSSRELEVKFSVPKRSQTPPEDTINPANEVRDGIVHLSCWPCVYSSFASLRASFVL